jgi:hypothetical protein
MRDGSSRRSSLAVACGSTEALYQSSSRRDICDVQRKRSAPLEALFQRTCEPGALVGGDEQTSHLFGRRSNRHYKDKLQALPGQREASYPVMGWYDQTSFAKQYTRGDRHGNRILPNETCSNDTRHFGVGRQLQDLLVLREKLAATNERCLALQADLLASTLIPANSRRWPNRSRSRSKLPRSEAAC